MTFTRLIISFMASDYVLLTLTPSVAPLNSSFMTNLHKQFSHADLPS